MPICIALRHKSKNFFAFAFSSIHCKLTGKNMEFGYSFFQTGETQRILCLLNFSCMMWVQNMLRKTSLSGKVIRTIRIQNVRLDLDKSFISYSNKTGIEKCLFLNERDFSCKGHVSPNHGRMVIVTHVHASLINLFAAAQCKQFRLL